MTNPAFKPEFNEVRVDLHRLAAYVIAPARYRQTERFGLRATPNGFGTPEFDEGGQTRRIRVEGLNLIDERDGEAKSAPITTLAAAAEFLDAPVDPETAAEHDSPKLGDVNAALKVTEEASLYLGWWYNMAVDALNMVRADEASVDASEPQLWPGHFDPAIEVGDEDHRGSYGASPGDTAIAEPYLYLGIWYADRIGVDTDDPFWNADSFPGRQLRLSEFGAGDPTEIAANFWREARDRLL